MKPKLFAVSLIIGGFIMMGLWLSFVGGAWGWGDSNLARVEKITPTEKLLLQEAKEMVEQAIDYEHSIRDEIAENHKAPKDSYSYYSYSIQDDFILIYERKY